MAISQAASSNILALQELCVELTWAAHERRSGMLPRGTLARVHRLFKQAFDTVENCKYEALYEERRVAKLTIKLAVLAVYPYLLPCEPRREKKLDDWWHCI